MTDGSSANLYGDSRESNQDETAQLRGVREGSRLIAANALPNALLVECETRERVTERVTSGECVTERVRNGNNEYRYQYYRR